MERCSVSARHREFHPTDGSFDRKSHLNPQLPHALTYKNLNLPQLRDNLFRFVSLVCHL